MMFNYLIVVMIFSSLYMSRGQITNKPLTTTRSVQNTEEPRTTPKGNAFILSFCLTFDNALCILRKECFCSCLYFKNQTFHQNNENHKTTNKFSS